MPKTAEINYFKNVRYHKLRSERDSGDSSESAKNFSPRVRLWLNLGRTCNVSLGNLGMGLITALAGVVLLDLGGNLRHQHFKRFSPHNYAQRWRPAWIIARRQAVRHLQHADHVHPNAAADQRHGADGSTVPIPACSPLHGLLHGSQLGRIRHG
ncbi:hypothetical protein MTO96_038635 [Rhipicephalus appendiculatus]